MQSHFNFAVRYSSGFAVIVTLLLAGLFLRRLSFVEFIVEVGGAGSLNGKEFKM